MNKYDELKRLAEAVREDNETYGDADMYEPSIGLSQAETKFAKCASPVAILELIAEVEALREKASELSVEAVRYRYLATTTWSDDVADALCLQDKERVDKAVDAAVLEAML